MHCLFGDTTKQVCGLSKACTVNVLLKWPVVESIVCLKLIIYLEGIWMEILFHNSESNQNFEVKVYEICTDLSVRIVEVYIFYSLNLGACFCFSFSNLVELFLCPATILLGFCSTRKYSSCQSYFSEVCQKLKCLCTWLHRFFWTSVHK